MFMICWGQVTPFVLETKSIRSPYDQENTMPNVNKKQAAKREWNQWSRAIGVFLLQQSKRKDKSAVIVQLRGKLLRQQTEQLIF